MSQEIDNIVSLCEAQNPFKKKGRTKWISQVAQWSFKDEMGFLGYSLMVEVDVRTGVAYTRDTMRPIDEDELSPWRRK